jgi:hypothetical protein
MATNTTKLALVKPDFVDVVDVSQLNGNADKIDAAAGFKLVTSATRPATPWAGQAIFETDTDLAFVWDGTAWMPSGGGGSIEISATAPASPGEGDLWWDSDNGKLYIYYNDGTSSQWVDAAGPSVAVQSTAPTGYEGQLWLDDTDGSMYVYYTDPGGGSSSWIGAVSRSGGILQVVSTTKTDTFSASVGARPTISGAVTGLSTAITPSSTSSKILITGTVNVSAATVGVVHVHLFRDGVSSIFKAAAAGNRQVSASGRQEANSVDANTAYAFTFLDTAGSTATTTYDIRLSHDGTAAQNVFVNRSITDTDATNYGRGVSSLTLMEVAG